MPSGYGLVKTSTRLLTIVKNKPHATQDDHADPLSGINKGQAQPNGKHATAAKTFTAQTSNDDESDINADPASSDDEASYSAPSSAAQLEKDSVMSSSIMSSSVTSQARATDKSTVIGIKRASAPPLQDDDDDHIFRRPVAFKRPKQSQPFSNIHAKPRPGSGKVNTYGKARNTFKMLTPRRPKEKPAAKFKPPSEGPEITAVPARPKFKVASGPAFDDTAQSTSELSSLAESMDEDEVGEEDTEEGALIKCHACNEDVSRLLWESFQDRYSCGAQMNYKWSQRFCKYHKEQEALVYWEEGGYPDIDWDVLPQRLQTSDRTKRIDAILAGQRRALFLDLQEERVRSRQKTALQALAADANGVDVKITGIGYYGPRGEKLITEYILREFSDKLRARATKERVITASGVAGGISGFVQAILAPELAITLIAEDMDTSDERAMEIMAETAALGEARFPEEEDVVVVDDDDE